MIAPYVALDVPSEVEAFGDSGGGEDGRELGWSRLRLLNSVVCVVRDCVDTILSHAAEHADRIDTDAEGGAEGAPRGVFLWDDSMSQVIGVDIIRQRLLPCLALFLKHGGPSNRPPGVSRFAVCDAKRCRTGLQRKFDLQSLGSVRHFGSLVVPPDAL